MAGIGWIHSSETTRNRVLKVLDILGEKGTIDELGIGVVRNAFSNEMFSGISTIMTRARYFYTVPYLMIDYLRDKQRKTIKLYMNDSETDLMELLTKEYEQPDKERIIGYTVARKNIAANRRVRELVRKPSEIYWGGIRHFGIFKKQHSFAQLSQAINQGKYSDKPKDNLGSDSTQGDDSDSFEKWGVLFDVPYVKDWDRTKISLNEAEADHFKQRIMEVNHNGLLNIVLSNPEYTEKFIGLKHLSDLLEVDFYQDLDQENQKLVKTAIQFWQLMYGAHIRFNCLIQKREIQKNKISFDDKWKDWLSSEVSVFDWDDFDREYLWELVESHSRIKWQTKVFINNWFDGIKEKISIEELDSIVEKQERYNKKDRSKLDARNQEIYNGWVGIDRLDYRLQNVQTIVKDIANPINTTEHA